MATGRDRKAEDREGKLKRCENGQKGSLQAALFVLGCSTYDTQGVECRSVWWFIDNKLVYW